MSMSYYRNPDEGKNNIRNDKEPLIVNCTGYVRVSRPWEAFRHPNRVDYYLQFLSAGELYITWDGKTVKMETGCFIIYQPHTTYGYYTTNNDEMCYRWLHFTGFYAGRLLSNLGLRTNHVYSTNKETTHLNRVVDTFTCLSNEFIHRRPGFDDSCSAMATSILVDLARIAEKTDSTPDRKLETIAYLHNHYRENIQIASLARMEHLSESRYREVFRKQTGFSPRDYQTILRLAYACDLLITTDLSVSEIAGECGYTDPLYFFRIFKQKKGITPTEFRSQIDTTDSYYLP